MYVRVVVKHEPPDYVPGKRDGVVAPPDDASHYAVWLDEAKVRQMAQHLLSSLRACDGDVLHRLDHDARLIGLNGGLSSLQSKRSLAGSDWRH